MLIDSRKKYWNIDYYKYWLKKTKDAEISSKKDPTVNIKNLFKVIPFNYFNSGKILEVGCGWGRLFNYFPKNLDIYGIDISKEMILKAKKFNESNKRVKILKESIAENIPFGDNFFNNIICFGTFDATYQELCLNEMLRVLKVNGILFLSLKNWKYKKNDKLGISAELAAKKNQHPNYFTNIKKLINNLENSGFEIVEKKFYKLRGDLSKGSSTKKIPQRFYEATILLKKQKQFSRVSVEYYSDSL